MNAWAVEPSLIRSRLASFDWCLPWLAEWGEPSGWQSEERRVAGRVRSYAGWLTEWGVTLNDWQSGERRVLSYAECLAEWGVTLNDWQSKERRVLSYRRMTGRVRSYAEWLTEWGPLSAELRRVADSEKLRWMTGRVRSAECSLKNALKNLCWKLFNNTKLRCLHSQGSHTSHLYQSHLSSRSLRCLNKESLITNILQKEYFRNILVEELFCGSHWIRNQNSG